MKKVLKNLIKTEQGFCNSIVLMFNFLIHLTFYYGYMRNVSVLRK